MHLTSVQPAHLLYVSTSLGTELRYVRKKVFVANDRCVVERMLTKSCDVLTGCERIQGTRLRVRPRGSESPKLFRRFDRSHGAALRHPDDVPGLGR